MINPFKMFGDILRTHFGYIRPEVKAPIETVPKKHRRIKRGVAKVSRKANGLTPLARDTTNSWWNLNQRLVDKKDPACEMLAQQVLSASGVYVSPLQIAGWFSELCRNGLLTESHRQAIITRRLRDNVMSVAPEYSQGLLIAIRDNHEAVLADKRAREEAHTKLRPIRKAQEAKRLAIGVQESLSI